jgi:hypothetical protein
VTQDGDLVRIDLPAGSVTLWLPAAPEIQTVGAPAILPNWCTYVCYGLRDYGHLVSRGMVVSVHGKALGRSGWRAQAVSGGVTYETPVWPLSDSAAAFQVPNRLKNTITDPYDTTSLQGILLYNPDFPIRIGFTIRVQDNVAVCLGVAHEDFARLVSPADPATPGEIIHAFVTGLPGVETIPDGVPNPVDHSVPLATPPQVAYRAVFRSVFAGLAPGLVGIEQIDLQVLPAISGPRVYDLFRTGVSCTANLRP